MRPALAAELRRARRNPTLWWLLLGSAGIGIVGTVAPLLAAEPGADMLTNHRLQQAMHGAAAGAVLVVVAGIIGMAGEWRFGQATQTFLATPERWRVVLAKCVTYMAVGAAYGVVGAAAALGAAWGWYSANDLALPLDRAAVWLTLLGCLAVSILFGLLGVGVGAITRNQVGAVVGALAWFTLVEPALFAAAPRAFRWLPGIASFSIRRQPTDDLLAVGPATAVLVGSIAMALAAGAWIVERDDVTA